MTGLDALRAEMFSLAVRWGWRGDNPCKGIERNQEQKRHRYLTAAELARLTEALGELRTYLQPTPCGCCC